MYIYTLLTVVVISSQTYNAGDLHRVCKS